MKKGKRPPRGLRQTRATLLPLPEPEDVTLKKARKLPLFGPGIVIDMPLTLQPAYMQLYHLVLMTLGEVRDAEKRLGTRKPAGMLWVKRVPKVTPTKTEIEHG